jgi:hypothetical protein
MKGFVIALRLTPPLLQAIRGIRVNRGWLFSGQQSVVDSDCD